MSDQKPSVSKGQQFHSFLQERGVEVPSDYNVFATEMQGENGKAFHGFLQERGVEVPSSYDDFASVFAPDVKKKEGGDPVGSGTSQSASLSTSVSEKPKSATRAYVEEGLATVVSQIEELEGKRELYEDANAMAFIPATEQPQFEDVYNDERLQKLRQKKQLAEYYIAADDYIQENGLDVTQFDFRTGDEVQEQAMISPDDIPQPFDDDYDPSMEGEYAQAIVRDRRKIDFQRTKVDMYMTHLEETDPQKFREYSEALGGEYAKYLQSDQQGLAEWLGAERSEGSDSIGEKVMKWGGRALTFSPASLWLSDLNPLKPSEEEYKRDGLRKANEVIVESDKMFQSYLAMSQQAMEDKVASLDPEQVQALEDISSTQKNYDSTLQKLTNLQRQNPQIFGDERRIQIQELNQMATTLNSQKTRLDRLRKQIESKGDQASRSDIERYNGLLEEYSQGVDSYNSKVESSKVQGSKAVIDEYNRYLSSLEQYRSSIAGDLEKVGEDYFQLASEYNDLSALRESVVELNAERGVPVIEEIDKLQRSIEQKRQLELAKDVAMVEGGVGDLENYGNVALELIVAPFAQAWADMGEGIMVSPAILADAIDGDRGSDFLTRFYDAAQENNVDHLSIPALREQGLFGDGNYPRWVSSTAAISNTFGQISTFAAGGQATSALKLGTRAGVFLTASASQIDANYQEALRIGLPPDEAARAATAISVVSGATELILNDATAYAPWEKEFRREAFRSLARNYARNGTWSKTLFSEAGAMATKSVSEGFEEFSATLAEGIMKQSINEIYGDDLYELPDAREYAEATALGFIGGAGMRGFGSLASTSHPENVNTFLDVIEDDDAFSDALSTLSTSLTDSEQKSLIELRGIYQGSLSGIDTDNLTPLQKAQVADRVVRIGQFQSQIKGANEGMRDIVQAQTQPKIEALKQEIVSILGDAQGEQQTTVETPQPQGVFTDEDLETIRQVEGANAEVDTYTTQVAGNAELTESTNEAMTAIESGVALNDDVADRAITAILSEIDAVDQSNMSDDAKTRITDSLFAMAEQIEDYDLRTKIEAKGTAEAGAVEGARRVVPKQSPSRKLLAGAEGTTTDGRAFRFQTGEDGRLTMLFEDGSQEVFDVPSLNVRDIQFDEFDRLQGVTIEDRFGNAVDLTGEQSIDIAIIDRMNKVGAIPEQQFTEAMRRGAERVRTEYRKSEQAQEQGRASEVGVEQEAEATPQELQVDSAEAQSEQAVGEGDRGTPRGFEGVDRAIEGLKSIEQSLDKFGRETLGINIPVAVAKGVVKVARKSLEAGKTIAEATSDAIDALRNTAWYKKLSDTAKRASEKNVEDVISGRGAFNLEPSTAKIKAFKNVVDATRKLAKNSPVTNSWLENTFLGKMPNMRITVLRRMDEAALDNFTQRIAEIIKNLSANPTASQEVEIRDLAMELQTAYEIAEEELNLPRQDDGDAREISKRKEKFLEVVLDAANRLSNSIAQLGDIKNIIEEQTVIQQLMREDGDLDANPLGVAKVLSGYLLSLQELRGVTADEIFAAAEAYYGYNPTSGDRIASGKIADAIENTAYIVDVLANGEKMPTGLEQIHLVSELVRAYRNKEAVAKSYEIQDELAAEAIGAIAKFKGDAKELGKRLNLAIARWMVSTGKGKDFLPKGIKYLYTTVERSKQANNNYKIELQSIRSAIDQALKGIKYSNKNSVSGKIARALNVKLKDRLQMNDVTRDILNVVDYMYGLQSMINNNAYYEGRTVKETVDTWRKLHAERNNNVEGKSVASDITGYQGYQDGIYVAVYDAMVDLGYTNEDGSLNLSAIESDFSTAEVTYTETVRGVFDELGEVVILHSASARHDMLPKFVEYVPIQEWSTSYGRNVNLTNGDMSSADVADAATTPSMDRQVGGEAVERGKKPARPSSSFERSTPRLDRPILMHSKEVLLGYAREVLRDVNVTPQAQAAKYAVVFSRAMQQNSPDRSRLSIERDTSFIAQTVNALYSPQVTRDETAEVSGLNRFLSWLTGLLGKAMTAKFLTSSFKPVADTLATSLKAMSLIGAGNFVMASRQANGKDSDKWEAVIDGFGAALSQRLSPETDTLVAGNKYLKTAYTGAKGKYSIVGSTINAVTAFPPKLSRQSFIGAVQKATGFTALSQRAFGGVIAKVAFADYVVSPAVFIHTVNKLYYDRTGERLDVGSLVSQREGGGYALRDFTDAEAKLLSEIVIEADATVEQISGASDPNDVPSLFRKAGKRPATKLSLMFFVPFMTYVNNETTNAWQALNTIFTGQTPASKKPWFWGVTAKSPWMQRASAANELSMIIGSNLTYMTLIGMGMKFTSTLLAELFGDEPDDEEDESAFGKAINAATDDFRKGIEALPNSTLKGLKSMFWDGLPFFALLDPYSFFEPEVLQAFGLEYSEEEAEANRYLKLTYGSGMGQYWDAQKGEFVPFSERFGMNVNSRELSRSVTEQPVFDFINTLEYMYWYESGKRADNEYARELYLPTKTEVLLPDAINMIMPHPFASDVRKFSNKELREAKKVFEQVMRTREMPQEKSTLEKETQGSKSNTRR